MAESPVFLATLGAEPQVVTIALQLLLAQEVPLQRAIVVHTSQNVPMIGRALEDLRNTLALPSFARIRWEPYPLTRDGVPLSDIATQEDAQATLAALYALVKGLKQQGHPLHFSIAGGRKVMALYGLVVAQLLFDAQDTLYYLFSDEILRSERRLLLRPGDHAELVPIPFLRWTSDAALIADVLRCDDPLQAMDRGAQLARERERTRWATFCRHVLTPAEEDVAALVVREGLTNQQVARRLGRSPKTVANQLSSIYAKVAEYIGPGVTQGVDRHRLITLLHDYYARQE